MTIEFGQDSIDLGLVVTDSASALGFYRDLLGLTHEEDMPMPGDSGGVMHRMRCGTTLVKLVNFPDGPTGQPNGTGVRDASGFRYISIHVVNLEEMYDKLTEAGVDIVLPFTEIRPGVNIFLVKDPDGNILELVRYDD